MAARSPDRPGAHDDRRTAGAVARENRFDADSF